MLWLTISLFLFVKNNQGATVSCYNDEGGTTLGCDTYCEIQSEQYGSATAEITKECSENPEYCDMFDAVNKCISATVTFENASYACNGNNAIVATNTVTETFKVECCNTDLCNNALSSSCSTSTTLQNYFDYSYQCIQDVWADVYSSFGDVFCGNYTDAYTTSSCNMVSVEVGAEKCQCNAYVYMYAQADTDTEKAAVNADFNVSEITGTKTEYGCTIVTACSTSGFTYSIKSYSFTTTLAVTGLTSTNYNIITVVSSIYASLILSSDLVESPLQIYISDATLSSSISVASTLKVVLQFPTMNDATTVRNGILNGSVSMMVGVYPTSVTVVGTVEENSYKINSGNMNNNIIMVLLLNIIGLIFNQ